MPDVPRMEQLNRAVSQSPSAVRTVPGGAGGTTSQADVPPSSPNYIGPLRPQSMVPPPNTRAGITPEGQAILNRQQARRNAFFRRG